MFCIQKEHARCRKTIESWAQPTDSPQTRRLSGCTGCRCRYARRMYSINGVAALSNLVHYSSLETMSIRNFSIKNNRKWFAFAVRASEIAISVAVVPACDHPLSSIRPSNECTFNDEHKYTRYHWHKQKSERRNGNERVKEKMEKSSLAA